MTNHLAFSMHAGENAGRQLQHGGGAEKWRQGKDGGGGDGMLQPYLHRRQEGAARAAGRLQHT